MRAALAFSVCVLAALSAVKADKSATHHPASQVVHQQPESDNQLHQLRLQQQQQPVFGQQQQQQPEASRPPHQQLQQQQQQQPVFRQQQQHPEAVRQSHQQLQQQAAAPQPYPLRRQTGSSLERARAAVMGFLESIMSAGARLRRMASARLSTMLRRRQSPAAPLKRAYRPQQPQPAAQHQPQPLPQQPAAAHPHPQPQQQQ